MKIYFLGTKGYHETKSEDHLKETSTLITYGRTSILVDWGRYWRGKIDTLPIKPTKIILTHSHPDHAGGVTQDLEPITIRAYKHIKERIKIDKNLWVIPYPVLHAGEKVTTTALYIHIGSKVVVCAPDMLKPSLSLVKATRSKLDVYIGDGASPKGMQFRTPTGVPTGHMSMYEQVRVFKHATTIIFTHFGSGATPNTEPIVLERLKQIKGDENVLFAYDGFSIKIE